MSLYFSDLVPGWTPAVLETFQEIDLIRAAQNRFFNQQNIQYYFIAGTVDMNNLGYPNRCNATT